MGLQNLVSGKMNGRSTANVCESREEHFLQEITNLTSITNDMVRNEPTIDALLPRIIEIFDDCILVAHNANFDIGF